MINKLLFLIVALCFLAACGGSKKVQSPPPTPQPEWVGSRPSSPIYYYGIGAARITHDVSQYQQAARQNALADMSGEISISISSNSVIHAFESNLNIREDFTSTIRAQTQQDLEGYELVDSWSDLNNHWVYYRLSKSKYQQLKEERKNNAATRALDFFASGINSRESGNIRLAIVQLIKALEPIKPYFSEPLPVDFKGSQIFLGNEIFKELSTTIAGIEIEPINSSINVKTGQPISSSDLQYRTIHPKAGPISEIPLVVSYSEKPIRNNKKRTTSSGIATFDVDIVRSTKSFETITATIDIDDILSEAGVDPFIRRLVARFTLPHNTVRINIEKPIIAIISNEINLGNVLSPGILYDSFRKKAIETNYQVTDNIKEADYVARITVATSRRADSGQFKNVSLDGVITVETSSGNQLYHKPIEGFVGRHFDLTQAGEEAFKEARRRMEISFFREIHEAINKR